MHSSHTSSQLVTCIQGPLSVFLEKYADLLSIHVILALVFRFVPNPIPNENVESAVLRFFVPLYPPVYKTHPFAPKLVFWWCVLQNEGHFLKCVKIRVRRTHGWKRWSYSSVVCCVKLELLLNECLAIIVYWGNSVVFCFALPQQLWPFSTTQLVSSVLVLVGIFGGKLP